ncbi:NAD-dependent protein deacetylase sirtuin-1 [Aplysia californica]|uniref:NAD-dependent protein deacetylase sirtuin-1 n=1 Tax=Aplysia californica TaxID=6500 RepID=A0ABM0JJK1_APLCA|nr:NAD-dependent protein deacetylase sirtuin-1 [Aplysia californica]
MERDPDASALEPDSASVEQPNVSEARNSSVEGQAHGSSVESPSVSSTYAQCPEVKPCPSREPDLDFKLKDGNGLAESSEGVSSQSNQDHACFKEHSNQKIDCSDNFDDAMDNTSEISDFSDLSQESWQPVQGPISWVQDQMRQGKSPRKILEELVPSGTMIPDGLDPIMLWKIIINIVSEPPKRKKLPNINTLDDVLGLLRTCKKIVVLTGAGVSVSCGIPDFRSRDGVYSRLAKDFPNLPDPQAMFDIHFFRSDPRPFFKFAKEIYPGQFKPSLCHHFIRALEENGKLLRNYTQNIDTLEQVAGIERVVQCHGSFASATCTICGLKVDSDAIKEDIVNQVIPPCPKCTPSAGNAVMKPDIVFFGESLPEQFHNLMALDKDECDLLIVIGSSLKVRPVALIPNSLPANIPQILINRERLPYLNFDVELLGNCDDIVADLCRRLGDGWEQLAQPGPPLTEVSLSALPTPPRSPWSEDSHSLPSLSTIVKEVADSSSAPTDMRGPSSSSAEDMSEAKPEGDSDVTTSTATSRHLKQSEVSEPTEEKGAKPLTVCHNTKEEQQHEQAMKSREGSQSPRKGKSSVQSHSLKRPFSDLASSSKSESEPTSTNNEERGSDPCCCSAETIETIVSAGHRKDVLYMPSGGEQSQQQQNSSHHHHHHHAVHSDHDSPRKSHHHHERAQVAESDQHGTDQQQPCSLSGTQEEKRDPDSESPPGGEDGPNAKKIKLSSQPELEDGDDQPAEGTGSGDDSSQIDSLGDIRKMWQAKRVSLATRLSDDQVLFLPPSCYVFKGAEVFSGGDSDDSDDESDARNESSSSSSDSDEEMNCALELSEPTGSTLASTTDDPPVKEVTDIVTDTNVGKAANGRVESTIVEVSASDPCTSSCSVMDKNCHDAPCASDEVGDLKVSAKPKQNEADSSGENSAA